MPIYAPTLPPRPNLEQGQDPGVVLARFELKRLFRHKIGLFFIFGFGITLLVQVAMLYIRFQLNAKSTLRQIKDLADGFLMQGPEYQADHLHIALLFFLWLFLAVVGGGIISRDTLYRTRPLIYAHPVSPKRYLAAKTGFIAALALAVMLPFILVPWLLSLLIAHTSGPVWVSLPLRLIPAAAIMAALMSTVVVGTSAMAGTPRAGTAWIVGIYFGSSAIGSLMAGLLQWPEFLSLSALTVSWPQHFCGVAHPSLSLPWTLLGTLLHGTFWLALAWSRTRPSEATL